MNKWFHLLLTLLIALTLSACGKMSLPFKKHDLVQVRGASTKLNTSTNQEFLGLVEKFEFHGKQEFEDPNFIVGDIPINFGDTTNPDYDGVCLVYPDDTKEIMIREDWWKSAHPIQKEVLVFHELGHCRLGRTHDEDVLSVNNATVKVSIMNSVIPDIQTYNQNKDGYITELFTYSRNALMSLLGVAQN
jgi:hypothetical protein